jgi:preprotein translocase subunit SecG
MGVLSGAATQTVFGGRGAGGFLTKATAFCATLFMLTSASLAYTSTSGRDSLARGANGDAGVTADGGDAGRDAAADAAAEAAAPTPPPAEPAVPAATGDAAAAPGDAAAAPTAAAPAAPAPAP